MNVNEENVKILEKVLIQIDKTLSFILGMLVGVLFSTIVFLFVFGVFT